MSARTWVQRPRFRRGKKRGWDGFYACDESAEMFGTQWFACIHAGWDLDPDEAMAKAREHAARQHGSAPIPERIEAG